MLLLALDEALQTGTAIRHPYAGPAEGVRGSADALDRLAAVTQGGG